ncbi:MAG: nucleotide sugar dehydrogenase [Gammaproteobacteria bacterium]
METISIIGVGYVGLPLAVEFSNFYKVTGFDLNPSRIEELNNFSDSTGEVETEDLKSADNLKFSFDSEDLKGSDYYIVTVPTPITKSKKPDLEPLKSACNLLGGLISEGVTIIFESTVYPGLTEEICIPILERVSGLKLNDDFDVGYSPERINPGDKSHRLVDINKIVSGSNEKAKRKVSSLYKTIINADVIEVNSIKVAEAAKIIENTQRDINIALMNELSVIFDRLDIDTKEVLDAASTKWNFLPFSPGLVGGHCISVDPYYLTFKAQKVGYEPDVVLSGRKINDSMSQRVAERTLNLLRKKSSISSKTNILILGFTFKENCPDVRNTKVIDIFKTLRRRNINVEIFDPEADSKEVKNLYQINLVKDEKKLKNFDAVIIAVAHDKFKKMSLKKIKSFCKTNSVIFDVKSIFEKHEVDGRL